jgi:hypothetical protein
MNQNLIQRLQAALPLACEWIDDYLGRHEAISRSVISLGMKRLTASYPEQLLRGARVVMVERVEFPPVDRFGLPELAALQQQNFGGITFKNTYFVRNAEATVESLHFHEMVHVVQWARLGVERFLLAYGIGLAQFGYERSPLEQMAYDLQFEFEKGTSRPQLVRYIETQTDAIWGTVAPLIPTALR